MSSGHGKMKTQKQAGSQAEISRVYIPQKRMNGSVRERRVRLV